MSRARPQRGGRRTDATPVKPRPNLLARLGVDHVDYKDTAALRTFLSDRGKIRPRRLTGLTVSQQRSVTLAIKTAREMALLPYPGQDRAAGSRSS